MISIIIPSHNEEKVIGATLAELFPGMNSGEIEVIVVCNGCSDNTVGIVKSFGETIQCIETPVPSKSNALNLGDAIAKGFPRFYQDADVVLSFDAVKKIAQILDKGHYLAASPKMKMDYHYASWFVRSYYDVWQQLPYVQEGMIGTGVYALSEEGRKRFEKFPEIIADDGYVRALFKKHERTSISDCNSIVRAPSTLNGLIKIKTRGRLGLYELFKKFPELPKNEEKKYRSAFFDLIWKINLWPKILIYLYVNIFTRYRAKKHAAHQGYLGWERDDSSREVL